MITLNLNYVKWEYYPIYIKLTLRDSDRPVVNSEYQRLYAAMLSGAI